MSGDFEPSEQFTDFFFLAIDHGFGSIEDGAGPLVPFAMTVDLTGQKNLHRFVTERLEDGVELAREHVDGHRESISMYAIAWDGYVTMDGERSDAICVEAADREDSLAVLFCQRYRQPKKRLFRRGKCERLGNPALIDRPKSRLLIGQAE